MNVSSKADLVVATPSPITSLNDKRFPLGLCPTLNEPSKPHCRCLKPKKPPKRPDPSIYSQQEQFLAGSSLSWDSPDIITNQHNGGLWDSIDVTVRNLSPDAPAIGAVVRLEYSRHGIGFPMTELFSMSTNLNCAGKSGAEKQLSYPTPQWLKDMYQNITVRASLIHAHDRNAMNNTGEQAYSGSIVKPGETGSFTFDIHNSTGLATTFYLYIQETGWNVSLSSNNASLMPGQTESITLSVQVPAGATGQKVFNVIAVNNGQLYGGIYHNFDI